MRRARYAYAIVAISLSLVACDATVYTTVKSGEGMAIRQLAQTAIGDAYGPTGEGDDALGLDEVVMAVHPISRDIYFADAVHNQILRLDASGVMSSWAGYDAESNTLGLQNEGWQDIVADAQGHLFVAQKNGTILQVAPDGGASLVAEIPKAKDANWEAVIYQRGLAGMDLDPHGNLYVASEGENAIWRIRRWAPEATPERLPIAAGHIVAPRDVAVGKDGALFVADSPGGKGRIAKVLPDGSVREVALVVGSPSRLVVDGEDNVYYIAPGYAEIRKVLPNGAISVLYTLPATPTPENAPIPVALALTADGGLLMTDSQGRLHHLSLTTAQASASQAVVPPTLVKNLDQRLTGIAVANGTTWLTGEWGILYGVKAGAVNLSRDFGPSPRSVSRERASFHEPRGMVFRPDGTLIVANAGHRVLHAISPGGTASVFAGNGKSGWVDGAAARASFELPEAMAIAPSGVIYVGDRGLIRPVSPDGRVSSWPRLEPETQSSVEIDDLAVGPDGRVYALLSREGPRLTSFTPAGVEVPVPGAEQVEQASAVAVDPQGRLLVLEKRYGEDNRGTTLTMLLPDGRAQVLVATRANDRNGQVLGEYKVQFWGRSWPAETLAPGDLTVGPDSTVYFLHHKGLYGIRNYGN